MSEPLKPHEVVAHATLTLADPDAEMRLELRKLIAEIVKEEVALYFGMNVNNTQTASNIINNQSYTIKQMAKAAIKEHFNNPQPIVGY